MFAYVNGQLGPTSSMVPVLVEAMRAGDAVAAGIVADFGGRLARYVTAGLKRFGMTGLEQDVVLSGGVFKADLPGLRESVVGAIRRDAPHARLVDACCEPVVGALLMALERGAAGACLESPDLVAVSAPRRAVSLDTPAIVAGAARHRLLRAH